LEYGPPLLLYLEVLLTHPSVPILSSNRLAGLPADNIDGWKAGHQRGGEGRQGKEKMVQYWWLF